jgi:hypothetical protein
VNYKTKVRKYGNNILSRKTLQFRRHWRAVPLPW